MEYWKDIEGFPGYQISSEGRVRSHNKVTYKQGKECHWKDRIIRPHGSAKDGRLRVIIWKDNKAVTLLIHRIEAIAFLGKPSDPTMTVNHKDGNFLNNSVDNLEWVTRAENIKHGFDNGLYESNCKRTRLISESGDIYDFRSKAEASKFLGRSHGYIYSMQKDGLPITNLKGMRFALEP